VFTTKKWVAAIIFALLFSATTGLANPAEGNPNSETSQVLAMPEEYINYTITRVNGVLWAKIDGEYPLYFLDESNDVASCVPTELPMVYPIPPNTTNIHVRVNSTEIGWNHWGYDTHHTAIGEWQMIYCVISPVSPYFLLTIHYEHPIEVVNGSNLFLYDLNIRDYLTEYSNTSIAYFTVRFETEVSAVHAYTTRTDSVWNTKNFTLNSEGDVETVAIEMRSVLGEPLAGDLVVMFNDPSGQVPEEFPYWLVAVPVFVVTGLLVAVVYRRTRR
jgi:hypothetical protein